MSHRFSGWVTQFLLTIKAVVVWDGRLNTSRCSGASPPSGAQQVIFLLHHLHLRPHLTAQPTIKKSLSCKKQQPTTWMTWFNLLHRVNSQLYRKRTPLWTALFIFGNWLTYLHCKSHRVLLTGQRFAVERLGCCFLTEVSCGRRLSIQTTQRPSPPDEDMDKKM